MSGMDGLETLAEIRAEYANIKVILSSGFNRSILVDSIHEDMHTDFIQKPYAIDELIEELAESNDTMVGHR